MTEYQFFDMVVTRTENTGQSPLRWSKDTVARVVARHTDPTNGAMQYQIQWQQSPHHGFSTAFVFSEDIQPHIDIAHNTALPPGEEAERCMATWAQ